MMVSQMMVYFLSALAGGVPLHQLTRRSSVVRSVNPRQLMSLQRCWISRALALVLL